MPASRRQRARSVLAIIAVGLAGLGSVASPAAAADPLETTWSSPEVVASGPISNARLAVSADGSGAVAAWTLDDQGGNQTYVATATISGNEASWGSPYLVSTDGVHTEAPAVVMSDDGTRATVGWNRTNPQIVQSKTATISGKTGNWDSEPIFDHADGGNLTPNISLAMAADGSTVVAAWLNDGSPTFVAVQAARVDASGATWEGAPHAVSPVGYPSGDVEVAISDQGNLAALIWQGRGPTSAGSYVAQSMAGSISNGISTWDGNTTELSAPGAFSTDEQIRLSADGTRATAVWRRGNEGVIQTLSATLVGTNATWGSSVVDLTSSDTNTEPQLGLSADGSAATVVWNRQTTDDVQTVASNSGVITANTSQWNQTATTLTPAGAQGADARLGLSSDGTGAVALWRRTTGGISSVSGNINGTTSTWQTVPTDISQSSDGEAPTLATAVDGSHATALWDGGESLVSASMKRTYTVTFNANGGSGTMASQSANSPTALATNTFNRGGATFAGWNTKADGGGTEYKNGASYAFRANATLYAQWLRSQVAASSCVKNGKAPAVPGRGERVLTGRQCKTNAGQRVGTRIEVKSARGDIRSPRLVCKVGSTTRSTIATGYGDGSRSCTKGRLVVRTYGSSFRIVVRWSAPAKKGFTSYKSTRTYRT